MYFPKCEWDENVYHHKYKYKYVYLMPFWWTKTLA